MCCGFVFLGLRFAHRPADKKFHFGYHKVKSFAALMAAIGMIVIGSIILYPSYESIMRPREIQHQILTMIVLAAASGISLHRGFQMRIIANNYDILSLKTDAMNSTKHSSASVIGFFSVLISSQLGVIHADATLYKRKEGEEHVTNSIFKKVESALLMRI